MREVYDFIASNWEPDDEIILTGFSRGAFTARAVAVSFLRHAHSHLTILINVGINHRHRSLEHEGYGVILCDI